MQPAHTIYRTILTNVTTPFPMTEHAYCKGCGVEISGIRVAESMKCARCEPRGLWEDLR
jgi:hypothetical protein